jgi:hypothetical protein
MSVRDASFAVMGALPTGAKLSREECLLVAEGQVGKVPLGAFHPLAGRARPEGEEDGTSRSSVDVLAAIFGIARLWDRLGADAAVVQDLLFIGEKVARLAAARTGSAAAARAWTQEQLSAAMDEIADFVAAGGRSWARAPKFSAARPTVDLLWAEFAPRQSTLKDWRKDKPKTKAPSH